jgi:acyl-coenzyme A thioesterase PaaI-like protein
MGMMGRIAPADTVFGLEAAGFLLTEVIATWVQDLGLLVESADTVRPLGAPEDWQPGAVVRLPYSSKICRDGGGVVCEQALMSLADAAMTIACAVAWQGYKPTRTIDQTTHFMRPVEFDVLADARILRVERNTCFGRVTMLSAWDRRVVGTSTIAYAMD